jgi:tetratricopeptide (TPR) repeat protein
VDEPDTAAEVGPNFFISRAGADAPFADLIGRILEDAGHKVVLQQWDFANRNFMERMHAALQSGARVVALLSNAYLKSRYTEAEWLSALADDPLNKTGRLIVLRIDECKPEGSLAPLAYWDLVPVRNRPDLVRGVVLAAIKPGRHKGEGSIAAGYWHASHGAVLHPEIRATASFTGRDNTLRALKDALGSNAPAAITQATAVHGLGGVGKSTLAREYAFRAQEDYAGVWWLSATRAKDSKTWEGVEKGLVDLGKIFIRGLDQAADRAAAARQTLQFIAAGGFGKPWLLVYDNVDDENVLQQWSPVGNAHVVVTSRLRGWRASVTRVEVAEWEMPEAISYLLADSGRPDLTTADAEAIATALGCLPLALSHAAAYLRENENATAKTYLAAITRHMNEAPEGAEYDRAVFATFQEQAIQAEERAPGARAVLSLAAFYAPDDVPEELFEQAVETYPAALAQVAADTLAREKAIGALNRFSLIEFDAGRRTFSIHRLVQAAARAAMGTGILQWANNALAVAFAAFPEPDFSNWPACERLTPHVRAVASHVTADSRELGWLLGAAASYLQERASLSDVRPLYEHSLAIRDRLAKSDPFNAGRQRDLSLSFDKVGNVQVAQGDLAGALKSYRDSLAIRDRLAKSDPGNAGWQRDLCVSCAKLGDCLQKCGELEKALDALRQAHEIMLQLTAMYPEHPGWKRDLAWLENRINELTE